MRRSSAVYRLVLTSLLMALYVALSYLRLSFGDVHLTLASLSPVLASFLLPLPDALTVAFLGEFLIQWLHYGLGYSTLLWCLPPLFRSLTISLLLIPYRKRGDDVSRHPVFMVLAVLLGNLMATLGNTGLIALQSYIDRQPVSVTFFSTLLRFLSSLGTGVLTALLSVPAVRISSRFQERAREEKPSARKKE